jgi:hypothetical protein
MRAKARYLLPGEERVNILPTLSIARRRPLWPTSPSR